MSARESSSNRARVDQERDRLHRQDQNVQSRHTPLKFYLLAYNLLSTALWLNLLLRTLSSVLSPHTPIHTIPLISRFFSTSSSSTTFSSEIDRLRNSYDHKQLGWWTKYTQTLAMLEVVHSVLGWVRSPVGTTAQQVASRLWTIWVVVEAAPETHGSPLLTTMLFAWSVTEVIRYSFYAFSVLGIQLDWLNYLRYTTFIPLYPLGATSEAFLSFSTLPPLSTLPYIPTSMSSLSPLTNLIQYLPASVGKALVRSDFGRGMLWRMAQASVAKSRVVGRWGAMELMRLVVFCIWWPALYVLYTHMFRQRRRVLGGGRRVGAKNKTK